MQAHGSFHLWVDNQVLLGRISGAWNEEEGWLYFKKIKEITKPIIHKPWAMILYLNDWELTTPETEQASRALVNWTWQHKLARVAEVYDASIVKQLQIDRLVKEGPSGFKRRQFSNETEAFAWLDSQGYPLELRQLINRVPND